MSIPPWLTPAHYSTTTCQSVGREVSFGNGGNSCLLMPSYQDWDQQQMVRRRRWGCTPVPLLRSLLSCYQYRIIDKWTGVWRHQARRGLEVRIVLQYMSRLTLNPHNFMTSYTLISNQVYKSYHHPINIWVKDRCEEWQTWIEITNVVQGLRNTLINCFFCFCFSMGEYMHSTGRIKQSLCKAASRFRY